MVKIDPRYFAESEQRQRDRYLLGALLDEPSLSGFDRGAFESMREAIEAWEPGPFKQGAFETMSDKQRRWAIDVASRCGINLDPPDMRKPVPRGKEVPLAPVLQKLPMKPPKRLTS